MNKSLLPVKNLKGCFRNYVWPEYAYGYFRGYLFLLDDFIGKWVIPKMKMVKIWIKMLFRVKNKKNLEFFFYEVELCLEI